MRGPLFKYEAIAESLMEMIRAGRFPDGRIPSEPELMRDFNVGKITVYKALQKLAEEDKVVRVKGSGTFVKGVARPRVDDIQSRMVAVAMETSSHFYGEVHDHIRKLLDRRGFIPVSYDVKQGDDTREIISGSNLLNLLKSGIRGLIIDGIGYWQNPFLKDIPDLRSVFVNTFDAAGEPPSSAALVDYKAGVAMAVECLARLGRKNLVFVRHSCNVGKKMTEAHRKNHSLFQMEEGFIGVALKSVVGHKVVIFNNEDPNIQLLARGLLSDKAYRPDGIVCASDIMAVRIMTTAGDMGIKVPSELSLTGFYNTPWCEECPVPLTSVSPRPEALAEQAVETLLAEPYERKITAVIPELVVRESCGGQRNQAFRRGEK